MHLLDNGTKYARTRNNVHVSHPPQGFPGVGNYLIRYYFGLLEDICFQRIQFTLLSSFLSSLKKYLMVLCRDKAYITCDGRWFTTSLHSRHRCPAMVACLPPRKDTSHHAEYWAISLVEVEYITYAYILYPMRSERKTDFWWRGRKKDFIDKVAIGLKPRDNPEVRLTSSTSDRVNGAELFSC